jgi:hypothetical protein
LQRSSSLIASAVLLLCIISATALAAHFSTPVRGQPSVSTVSATTVKNELTATNSTQLSVTLSFPNGTRLTNGSLYAGTQLANLTADHFLLTGLASGSYPLNLTGETNTYLPPTSAQVSTGLNLLNLTVYQLSTLRLVVNGSLSFNGTQPGPSINVGNASAIKLIIENNTTQVFDVAVVYNLYNTSSANVLFDSLSSTISAGGSVSDTFIVSRIGTFFYQSMTGNQAKQGENGDFVVNP